MPDKKWMVDIFSKFKKDDEIFGKGFLPPQIKAKKEEEKKITIRKHLLEGLPIIKMGKHRKRTKLETVKDAKKKQK